MLFDQKRILILAPHTDDAEFGCGGTIAKLVEQGCEVYCTAFSSAVKSLPPGWAADTLQREVKKATAHLGLPPRNLRLMDYPVREFPRLRQEILDEMLKLKAELRPEVVFLPCRMDTHQDHEVVSNEGFRAFKDRTILGYELPWNNLTFLTNCFVYLDETHLEKKIKALECYESQRGRPYASAEFVRSLAITRGTQIGTRYAEAYECIRWVWNGHRNEGE